jgi:predicted nucleotidyltransferase
MKNEGKLIRLFQKYDDVQLAYLFGSAASNEDNSLSDIDIGVLVKDSMSKKNKFKLQLKLLSDLTSILANDKIDLTIMNDVSLSLNFEIIKSNHSIFVRDRSKKIEFEHKILSRYLDRKYYDKRSSNEFINKVSLNGLSF